MYKYETKSEGRYLAIQENTARNLVDKIFKQLEVALVLPICSGLERAQTVEAYANALTQVMSLRVEPAPRGKK